MSRPTRPGTHAILFGAACLIAVPVLAGDDWVTYTNESSIRMSSDQSVGLLDVEEKDYAFADLDKDGDQDLVVVRKQPFTTAGGKRNVLFMNDGGNLVDQTAQYSPDFLDATNDRDVVLVDVDNDTWLDVVTAAACNNCNAGGITDDSRLYFNLGEDNDGNWLGLSSPTVLFGGGNNFCHVAAGDLDGDNYADLYFVSYNDSFEDQALMNQGAANPGSFVNGNNRFTSAMRGSSFGSAVHFADMDNDGDLDVVKSENGPAEIFRNAGNGFFDMLDPTYSGAAYHVGVGHLNNDGMWDLVLSDDGVDRYILNNGNLLNGAGDPSTALPGSTNGFGSDSYVVDLDGNGFNDILIADVDVDAGGCARTSDILRNTIGSFVDDSANIPSNQLVGVHDIAIFDIDDDSFLDMVIGRCSGTQIWINSPPSFIEFAYPNGLPEFVPPNQEFTVDININAVGAGIEPGTETIHVSIDGGPFVSSALAPIGGGNYQGVLGAGTCGDAIDYYISAELDSGLLFRDPPSAPNGTFTAIAATGINVAFEDDLEGDTSGWTVVNDKSLTSGAWEVAEPNVTTYIGQIAAPASDTTPDGVMAFVTQNGPPGGTASADDVDGGPSTLYSPMMDLSGTDGFIKYSVWVFSEAGIHDVLDIEISNDAGANWTLVETLSDTSSVWFNREFYVSDFVEPTDQVQLRFAICDCPNDSITEAALDDLSIEELACDAPPCPWDLDGSGGVDTVDFLDLLSQWGSDPGGAPDFNGDGNVDTVDFLELLSNWGDCP